MHHWRLRRVPAAHAGTVRRHRFEAASFQGLPAARSAPDAHHPAHTEGERLENVGEVEAFVLGLREIFAALLNIARAAQLAPPGGAIHTTL